MPLVHTKCLRFALRYTAYRCAFRGLGAAGRRGPYELQRWELSGGFSGPTGSTTWEPHKRVQYNKHTYIYIHPIWVPSTPIAAPYEVVSPGIHVPGEVCSTYTYSTPSVMVCTTCHTLTCV